MPFAALPYFTSTHTLMYSHLGVQYCSQRIQLLAKEQLPEQREEALAHGHISASLVDGGKSQFNF